MLPQISARPFLLPAPSSHISSLCARDASDCEEAAGATRVKRLRDTLGNQMVSELLVKTIARRGYVLAVGKDVIRMM